MKPGATQRGGPLRRATVADLARAERAGAAPGTEPPLVPAESFPLRGGKATLVMRTLAGVACGLAAWHAAHAGYLHGKAWLGQRLLERAWVQSARSGADVRPWPWADTHPVARIVVPGRDVDLVVLAGAHGRTLAWGPGHVDGTATPGARGNAVVTAHRDTHFGFLRDLRTGDRIVAQGRDGKARAYRVERTFVADAGALRLPADPLGTTLTLVTCYPFDALDPGTPLRYAVIARGEPESAGGQWNVSSIPRTPSVP
jgi:sortase A